MSLWGGLSGGERGLKPGELGLINGSAHPYEEVAYDVVKLEDF